MVMSIQIFIDGLGYRNPIAEYGQIIWYLEQMAKTKNKAWATRYWIDLREQHEKRLLEFEAFELLSYLKTRATDAKQRKRAVAQLKAKKKAVEEHNAFMLNYEKRKATMELINKISLN